jgi:hypothetical protein
MTYRPITCALLGAAAAALLPSFAVANDPASSWLAYAVARGNGAQVLQVNATWIGELAEGVGAGRAHPR